MGDFDLSFDQANNQQQSKYDPYLLSDEEQKAYGHQVSSSENPSTFESQLTQHSNQSSVSFFKVHSGSNQGSANAFPSSESSRRTNELGNPDQLSSAGSLPSQISSNGSQPESLSTRPLEPIEEEKQPQQCQPTSTVQVVRPIQLYRRAINKKPGKAAKVGRKKYREVAKRRLKPKSHADTISTSSTTGSSQNGFSFERQAVAPIQHFPLGASNFVQAANGQQLLQQTPPLNSIDAQNHADALGSSNQTEPGYDSAPFDNSGYMSYEVSIGQIQSDPIGYQIYPQRPRTRPAPPLPPTGFRPQVSQQCNS